MNSSGRVFAYKEFFFGFDCGHFPGRGNPKEWDCDIVGCSNNTMYCLSIPAEMETTLLQRHLLWGGGFKAIAQALPGLLPQQEGPCKDTHTHTHKHTHGCLSPSMAHGYSVGSLDLSFLVETGGIFHWTHKQVEHFLIWKGRFFPRTSSPFSFFAFFGVPFVFN